MHRPLGKSFEKSHVELNVELLCLCYDAFCAMRTADESNKFLKSIGEPHTIYSGSGQYKLRAYMMDRLEQHFGIGKYSA